MVTKMYRIALKKAKKIFFENSENRDVFEEKKIVKPNRSILLNGAGVNLSDYPFTKYPQYDFINDLPTFCVGSPAKVENGIGARAVNMYILKNLP